MTLFKFMILTAVVSNYQSVGASVYSEIHVIEKRQTWREAAEECRNKNQGHLVGSRDPLFQNEGKLKSYIQHNTVWTGNYKSNKPKNTTWLEFKGCFNVSKLKGYRTKKTRVYDCYKYCNMSYGGYIGSNKQSCFCANGFASYKNYKAMEYCSIDLDGNIYGNTEDTAALYRVFSINLRKLCEVGICDKLLFRCHHNQLINSLKRYKCGNGRDLTLQEVKKRCIQSGISMISQRENHSCNKFNKLVYNRRYDEISDLSYDSTSELSENILCQNVSLSLRNGLESDYVRCDNSTNRYMALCKRYITLEGKSTDNHHLTSIPNRHQNVRTLRSMVVKSKESTTTAQHLPIKSLSTKTTRSITTIPNLSSTSSTTPLTATPSTATSPTTSIITTLITAATYKSLDNKSTIRKTTKATTTYIERPTYLFIGATKEHYTNDDNTQGSMTTSISLDNISDSTFYDMTNIIMGITISTVTMGATILLIILISRRKRQRKKSKSRGTETANSAFGNSIQEMSGIRNTNSVPNEQSLDSQDHLHIGQEDDYREIGEMNTARPTSCEKVYSTSSDYVYDHLNRHRTRDVTCYDEYATFAECGEEEGIYKSNVSRAARHQEINIDDVYDSAAKVAERVEGIYELSYHSKQYSD